MPDYRWMTNDQLADHLEASVFDGDNEAARRFRLLDRALELVPDRKHFEAEAARQLEAESNP